MLLVGQRVLQVCQISSTCVIPFLRLNVFEDLCTYYMFIVILKQNSSLKFFYSILTNKHTLLIEKMINCTNTYSLKRKPAVLMAS